MKFFIISDQVTACSFEGCHALNSCNSLEELQKPAFREQPDRVFFCSTLTLERPQRKEKPWKINENYNKKNLGKNNKSRRNSKKTLPKSLKRNLNAAQTRV